MSNDDFDNHTSNNDDFVMPEYDGVDSGHPIENTIHDENLDESSNSGGSKRGVKSRSQHAQSNDSNSASQVLGWSIKNKLLGSYFMLTLLIAFLGFYSYSNLIELSGISLIVTKEQSQIAKSSEEIKATVYKIRDAEKDFTYLEEQESLDKVTRYTDHIRKQLTEISVLAEALEKSTGKSIGSEYIWLLQSLLIVTSPNSLIK
ncbi:hypothetical protein A9Q99_00190 [Gammaproteobacteria bacterium 45_16_T64]|nr:hypothetical protein A9Q99_00190 [Gammaproteobacteria bacterium 45_16_T64]